MKLLLIEDDEKLVTHLELTLKAQGFSPTTVGSESELTEILNSPLRFDLLIMDRLLKGFDTKRSLPAIKAKWPQALILVLSAISTPNERATMIDSGADDYLGKPFSTTELLARIRALRRRTPSPSETYLQLGNLIVDSIKRIVVVDEKSENLPAREFALLRTLIQEPSKVWSKDELLDYVWGQNSSVDTNVVESTMANLRKKLSELKANVTIKNLRNVGYWIAQ